MTNNTIYDDSLGNSLIFEDGVYVVQYPQDENGDIRQEELPFQIGDIGSGINGVSNELLLEAIIHRLHRLETKTPSIFNRMAIRLLTTARKLLDEKIEDESFRSLFDNVKLCDADTNALEAKRWNAIVTGVETVTGGLRNILSDSYRHGSKMRAVDVKRLKQPEIIKIFRPETK